MSKDQRVGSQAASHRSMNLDINVVIVDNNQFHLTAKKRKLAPSDTQSTK